MRYKAVLVGTILAITSNCVFPSVSVAESFMLVAAETIPGSNPANQTPVLRFEGMGTGPVVPLSTIPGTDVNDPIGVAFSPWGELFVGNRHGNVGGGVGSISRFTFDGAGNFIPNGTITAGLEAVHGMAFSPSGELFAANHALNTISRFTFDEAKSAIPNGTVSTPGGNVTLGVSFSPSGEMFVASDGSTEIQRFVFDPLSTLAIPNGTLTIPGIPGTVSPHFLTFNGDGELFIPDQANSTVYRYTFDAGGVPSANGTIGVANVQGLAFSPSGELFASNHGGGGISRFTFDAGGAAVPNGLIPTNSMGGLAIRPEIPLEPFIERFDNGVGVFSTTVGNGDSNFIHDVGDQNINGTFIRNLTQDGRFAPIGRTLDQDAVVGFRFDITPHQVEGGRPKLGFYSLAEGSAKISIELDNAPVTSRIGPLSVHSAESNLEFDFTDPTLWTLGDTFRIEVFLDGINNELTMTAWRVIDSAAWLISSDTFVLPSGDTFSFDSVGMWNIVDNQAVGATSLADIDNFAFLTEPSPLGDLNGDGFVGIADLNIILSNWNEDVGPGNPQAGDITGDGFVGLDDLNVVLGNWNSGVPPVEASSVVPEPGTLLLLLCGSLCLRRRSCIDTYYDRRSYLA
jgi:WD40 repeat protein